MLNTQVGVSRYTRYTVFPAHERIHTEYTAEYTSPVTVDTWFWAAVSRKAKEVERARSTGTYATARTLGATLGYSSLKPYQLPDHRGAGDGVVSVRRSCGSADGWRS